MGTRCTEIGTTREEEYVFDVLMITFELNRKTVILVLPRVMFERFSETDYSHVLMYESARDDIAELLVQVCKKYKFDGIVLEVWFQLSGRVQDTHLLRLTEHLGRCLYSLSFEY